MDKTKLKEMVTQIYSLTNDGKNLPPPILETVELAEGKYLNERGYEAIHGILALAEAGLYSNPTHGQNIRRPHDLEHITTDSEGYLYFKDKFVSRRSGDFESIFGKRKLEQLQSKCLFLERCKIGVTSFNVQFPFEFMKDAYNRDMFLDLDKLTRGRSIIFTHITIDGDSTENHGYFMSGQISEEVVKHNEHQIAFNQLYPENTHCTATVNEYVFNNGGHTPQAATQKELRQIELAFDALCNRCVLSKSNSAEYSWDISPEDTEDDEDDEEMEM